MRHTIDSTHLVGSYPPHITLTFEAPDHRASQLAELVQRLTNSPGQAMQTAAHAAEVEVICREVDRLLAAAEVKGYRYMSGASLLFAALPVVYGDPSKSNAWKPGALMGRLL